MTATTAPQAPADPAAWLTGNARPGNIFAGVVNPTLGYGLKGVIWYQGESNAGRAYEHAALFPFLIEQWRKEQGQGDFSFYWAQLADFKAEAATPGESDWAELRETQTKTLSLPNTGQAVIIDVGEGRDIHPFEEITDILEFVPQGHEVPGEDDDDDKPSRAVSAADDLPDLPEVEDVDKDMEKNLRWDDEEEAPAEAAEGEEEGGPPAKGSSGSPRRRR